MQGGARDGQVPTPLALTLAQVLLYHNALGSGAPHEVAVIKDTANPGSSRTEPLPKGGGGGGGSTGGGGPGSSSSVAAARETAMTVLLDDLFDGGAGRPRHPFFDRPIAPRDIAAIKVRRRGGVGRGQRGARISDLRPPPLSPSARRWTLRASTSLRCGASERR